MLFLNWVPLLYAVRLAVPQEMRAKTAAIIINKLLFFIFTSCVLIYFVFLQSNFIIGKYIKNYSIRINKRAGQANTARNGQTEYKKSEYNGKRGNKKRG